jgi:hypothetical protein
VQEVRPLTSELVAHSSLPQGDPGWLPDPSTNGQDTVEDVLANLRYTDKFSPGNLALQQISQLLWAGYGCTPHVVSGGKKGLTVPSAVARYYLTGTIYLVNEKGIFRYQDRNPGTNLTTRDHRLEPMGAADSRGSLAAAVKGLPQAPCYIVVCLPKVSSRMQQEQQFALFETGFVAGNVLMQATALGLGCHFESTLSADEQSAVRKVTGIPAAETPQVIISVGAAAE